MKKIVLLLLLTSGTFPSDEELDITLDDFIGHKIEDIYYINDKLYLQLDGDIKVTMQAEAYEITIEQK